MEGSGSGTSSSSSSKGSTLRRNAKRLSVLLRAGSRDSLQEGSVCASSSFTGIPPPQLVRPPTVAALEQQQKQLNKAERPAQRKALESRREQLKTHIVCVSLFSPLTLSLPFFFSQRNPA